MKSISKMSSGYVYYVTIKGITGSKLSDVTSIRKNVKKIKKSLIIICQLLLDLVSKTKNLQRQWLNFQMV